MSKIWKMVAVPTELHKKLKIRAAKEGKAIYQLLEELLTNIG